MSRNERKQTSKQEIKKGRKKANKQERTQRKKIQDIRSNVAIPLEINKGTVAGRPKAIGSIYIYICIWAKMILLQTVNKDLISHFGTESINFTL